jgi:antitoxin component HigA of HigAB toxin-antitoxin module
MPNRGAIGSSGFGELAKLRRKCSLCIQPGSQGTVSKIMTGARSITVEHAKRLARHFKMRPEPFLNID